MIQTLTRKPQKVQAIQFEGVNDEVREFIKPFNFRQSVFDSLRYFLYDGVTVLDLNFGDTIIKDIDEAIEIKTPEEIERDYEKV